MKWNIFWRGFFYAVPLFLTPFVDKMGDFLLNGIWPSAQSVVYCGMVGLGAMCIGLRAFSDGSVEREAVKQTAADAAPKT